MQVVNEIEAVRQIRWADPGLSWGFVPTMGYLHQGHLSLVKAARVQNDRVAVSIFVNPTQFAPDEDLSSYPRDKTRDLALLAEAEVDLVFMPDRTVIYPADFQTTVMVAEVTRPLEGDSRPTHFAGVATVVAKLFNIMAPTRAYFGQKDAQQTVVIGQLVRDLNFDVEIVVVPTVREADGLAMSSRNAYLTPAQRRAATVLYRALNVALFDYETGERRGDALRDAMKTAVLAEPLARLDYVSVADPRTLVELTQIEAGALFSLAVFLGDTRLIDNVLVT